MYPNRMTQYETIGEAHEHDMEHSDDYVTHFYVTFENIITVIMYIFEI